jgi:hypothetical protein
LRVSNAKTQKRAAITLIRDLKQTPDFSNVGWFWVCDQLGIEPSMDNAVRCRGSEAFLRVGYGENSGAGHTGRLNERKLPGRAN